MEERKTYFIHCIIKFEAVWVHGWVYHVETGLVEDVMLETSLPEEMRSSFELIFKK
jgi:carbonic anhydrase